MVVKSAKRPGLRPAPFAFRRWVLLSRCHGPLTTGAAGEGVQPRHGRGPAPLELLEPQPPVDQRVEPDWFRAGDAGWDAAPDAGGLQVLGRPRGHRRRQASDLDPQPAERAPLLLGDLVSGPVDRRGHFGVDVDLVLLAGGVGRPGLRPQLLVLGPAVLELVDQFVVLAGLGGTRPTPWRSRQRPALPARP